MKNIGLAVLLFVLLGSAEGAESVQTGDLERIFLVCRHVGGPTVADDLRSLAAQRGASDAEMAARLMELAKSTVTEETDARQRHLAEAAVAGLGLFGGEAERDFALELMRTTRDKNLRQAALRACIRMVPDKWEEVVREVAEDDRFDSYAKFGAFEEAFRLGKSGDGAMRQRMKEVFSEFAAKNPHVVSRERLDAWIWELEKP